MQRLARRAVVLFWEEPEEVDGAGAPELHIRDGAPGVRVITPRLPRDMPAEARDRALSVLLHDLVAGISAPIVRWYYTPMMLPFSRGIRAACTVYDCMDELANFRFAAPELVANERELFAASDLVFTGGYSLYEAKRRSHPAVFPYPSSVDRAHFAAARDCRADPEDQAHLAGPRLGFFGVVDERMDLSLLGDLARARPNWNVVVVGPVVKIDPADLPREPNIHYLGGKSYEDLPRYASGWDVALMPFAINEATRFISPTKTPEYLAAGLPVVSTPIVDVVRHYGGIEAVQIADTPDGFVEACERALALRADPAGAWLEEADRELADQSWDSVAARMLGSIERHLPRRRSGPLRNRSYDYLVVGAGFAGSVMAERLADSGKRVLIVDRRNHVAGNAYDEADSAGILVHRYGPHIFHTNSSQVFAYLSRFTDWRPYEHRVLAHVRDQLVPMPINRTTLNRLYELSMTTEAEVDAFLAGRAEARDVIKTSEDVVVAAVGRELYETFFRGYTRKQWGLDPSMLDRSVTARVPTRTNTDDRYFTDRFQAMPAAGYTAMFERMLDHPNIDVEVGVDFEQVRDRVPFERLVFTGPIDEYFGFCHGKLPYRSLEFRHETHDTEWVQPVAVVNYPDEAVPYTRITEYKHLTGQTARKTSISYEFPRADGDPYYPVPRPENQLLFQKYEALAAETPQVLFVGRLATYRYYNMDQIVGQALATHRRHMDSLGVPLETTSKLRESVAVAAE